MPVEKFRSIEDMNAAPIRPRPGGGFERFIRHCEFFLQLSKRRYPRGVFRFRSLAEAQASRERVALGQPPYADGEPR